MFWRISLEEIKASLNISRRGMWGKPQRKWQHALFLSRGWIPDCLQTTAGREHISEGNLITRRRSHGTTSCKRVLFGCDAPVRLLFGSPSTLGNFYERNVLLQCMTPLSCDLFKANFSVKHDLTSPDYYFSLHFRVSDTPMWCINFGLYDTRIIPITSPHQTHEHISPAKFPLFSVSHGPY